MITRTMTAFALLLVFSAALPLVDRYHADVSSKKSGKVMEGLERRLYVADSVGVSIYDINDGHKLLGKIEISETGAYKGIAASPQLGRLYLTSNLEDELVCLDLETGKVIWRKQYGKYADS